MTTTTRFSLIVFACWLLILLLVPQPTTLEAARSISDAVLNDAPPSLAYTIVYDYDANGNLIYKGWSSSAPGPLTSQSKWSVRRYTYNGSNQLTKSEWANGSVSENNIWDNRASLTYK